MECLRIVGNCGKIINLESVSRNNDLDLPRMSSTSISNRIALGEKFGAFCKGNHYQDNRHQYDDPQ